MSENQRRSEPQLAVIILAAGQGTRMKSTLPKVLHRIGGRPLLGHVLDTARTLGPQSILVVVRHERDLVADVVARHRPRDRRRRPGRDPGHRSRGRDGARAACPTSPATCSCSAATCRCSTTRRSLDLIRTHRESGAAATVLSAVVGDATGYGRVIRDSAGGVQRIVEQKDATDDEASVSEINAGVYVFQAAPLRAHISLVGTANAQGERYLTDVVALLRDSRLSVGRLAGDGCRSRAGRERPGAAVRGRAAAQRAHCPALAARGRDDPRPGDDMDRRDCDASPPTSPCCRTRTSCAPPRSPRARRSDPTRAWSTARSATNAVGHAHRRDARRDRRRCHGRPVRLPAAGHLPRATAARSARSSRRRTPRSASAARCRTCRTSATRRSARA